MITPRICIVFDDKGFFIKLVSDVPVRAYYIDESCQHDRVYELSDTLEIGVENVRQTLGDSPVWHKNDDIDMRLVREAAARRHSTSDDGTTAVREVAV